MTTRIINEPWELQIKDRTGRSVWAETRETYDEDDGETTQEVVLFVRGGRTSQPKIDVGVLREETARLKTIVHYAIPAVSQTLAGMHRAMLHAEKSAAEMMADDGWPEESVKDRAWHGEPLPVVVHGEPKFLRYLYLRVAPFVAA